MESCKEKTQVATASSSRRRLYPLLGAALAAVVWYGIGASQTSLLVSRAVELVSVSIFGTSGNNASNGPAANADGSFVAFWSDATNLVPTDTNQVRDAYLRNRVQQGTQRVSVNGEGAAGNRASEAQGGAPAVNGTGTLVAFYSDATNLVADDTNAQPDVFVRDVESGTTELVSLNSEQMQANGPSLYPSISADGRFVAFQSAASNLAAGDATGQFDIYVRDRQANTTERLCAATPRNGFSITPAISADGNVVAFASNATNLVANDTNGRIDVFVCDRSTGAIDVISINDMGGLGNGDSILPAINFDGTLVAFKSTADNLVPNDRNGVVDVFARDRTLMKTERVSVSYTGGDANDASFPPSVDYSGRFVAFGSAASNLVPNDFNNVSSVFVRDRMQGLTLLVDVNARGEQANNGTLDVPPSISGDARQIAFVSLATNLTANDNNTNPDVFITTNPFACDTDEDCPAGEVCEGGFCVVVGTPTPTPTAGPEDCCQCQGPACQDPTNEGCPTDCDIVRNAACLDNVNCVTFTPTPEATATPTAGADDCCQCPNEMCEAPGNEGCPSTCEIVRQAVCLDGTDCATFTPTPTMTTTPTAGPNDCCQCTASRCEDPGGDGCPAECEIVRDAVCVGGTACATFTPTPTAGPNDCCQCAVARCEAPGDDGCPQECETIRNAVCVNNTNCATITPTPSPTPSGGTPTFSPTQGATATATTAASSTATSTRTVGTPTVGTPTPTFSPSRPDKEGGCNCTIGTEPRPGSLNVPMWLLGPAALLAWRRRYNRRTGR
jgi:MYXO-CTERM domain-containing protein